MPEIEVGENSFVTLQEANDYLDSKLDADAWDNAGEEKRKKALIEATRRIAARPWRGRQKERAQTLPFPRCLFDPYRRLTQTEEIEFSAEDFPGAGWWCEQEVSDVVKHAQIEEALALLEASNDGAGRMRRRLQEQGVTSVSMSRSSEQYSEAAVNAQLRGQRLMSSAAEQLMAPYAASSVAIQ